MFTTTMCGTQYEKRYQLGKFRIGSTGDVTQGDGRIIVGHFLTPESHINRGDAIDAIFETMQISDLINWRDALPIAHAVASVPSGYRLIVTYQKECPIMVAQMIRGQKGDGDFRRIAPPDLCTRERKILSNLEDGLMEVLRSENPSKALEKHAEISNETSTIKYHYNFSTAIELH